MNRHETSCRRDQQPSHVREYLLAAIMQHLHDRPTSVLIDCLSVFEPAIFDPPDGGVPVDDELWALAS